MYKQTSSNRRYSKTSNNKSARNSGNRGHSKGGYKSRNSSSRSNWKGKNRHQYRQKIAHSMYISNAEDVKTSAPYIPEKNFCDFHLHPSLVKNISDRGYVNPTKIQDQAIPEILKGKDLLGTASTGSGKTGAFLIPMIDKVLKNPGNRVLIISPTRELANQISSEFRKFAKDTRLRVVLVIGGESSRDQIRILKRRPQFVVATPGRLMDLEKRNFIVLGRFNNVVLDEVDRMLDMGFVEDIKMLISKLSAQRQSLFFSATVGQKEEVLANTLLNTPVRIMSSKQSALESISQDIVKIRTKEQKIEVLQGLLKQQEFKKVLVFSGTKRGVDKISNTLRKKGVKVDALHGDKSQNVRSKVLSKFKQDKINVLIATDVAARGLDISNISHVINYDEPANYKDYIHRIGRTGRIGKKGTALTFVLDRRA